MLLFQRLSQEIRNACIEVHSVLGTGLLESCYEEALIYELGLRGIECKSQLPIIVSYKDKVIGKYFADVLVENKIILELKCVRNLTNEHFAQTIHYLNATDYSLGLLINFGTKTLEFKRILKASDSE